MQTAQQHVQVLQFNIRLHDIVIFSKVVTGCGSVVKIACEKLLRILVYFSDYRNEYRKTKNNISAARAREDLLGSVKRDIDEYKGLIGGKQELYQREREHLLSSDRLADQAIEVARAGSYISPIEMNR